MFYSAQVKVYFPEPLILEALVSEFPPHAPFEQEGRLHVAQPRVGSKNSANPLDMTPSPEHTSRGDEILLMERGGNLTFCQKALQAQSLGCKAVICSNSVPIWPYTMKDSKQEAETFGLSIPIVMISQSNGKKLLEQLKKAQPMSSSPRVVISAQVLGKDASSCVICTESYQPNDAILQIPTCGHAFHESCAKMWLKNHSTCPFCRRQLPCQDEELEQERRREMRLYAGGGNGSAGEEAGGGRQWEDIFG
jgi:hypothetical protein